jgi:hypothetical protein
MAGQARKENEREKKREQRMKENQPGEISKLTSELQKSF